MCNTLILCQNKRITNLTINNLPRILSGGVDHITECMQIWVHLGWNPTVWLRCKLVRKELKYNRSEIQRAVNPPDFSSVRQEIHTFADASTSGFGACSFLRSIEKHCTLIFDELRAAPIKATTIPRWEQQAALLAAKQTAVLTEEPQLDDKCYLWSDSKIIQRFISMTKSGFKPMTQTD